jgi:hypothetical protein
LSGDFSWCIRNWREGQKHVRKYRSKKPDRKNPIDKTRPEILIDKTRPEIPIGKTRPEIPIENITDADTQKKIEKFELLKLSSERSALQLNISSSFS